MGRLYGPLNPLGLHAETGAPLKGFPHNVQFFQGNYVLESDLLLGKDKIKATNQIGAVSLA